MSTAPTTINLNLTIPQAQLLEHILGISYGMLQDMMRDEQAEGNVTQDGVDDNLINYGIIMGQLQAKL